MRGSSSVKSRGTLITISLCLRFTELTSTLRRVPEQSASARPYPVMLLTAVQLHKRAPKYKWKREYRNIERRTPNIEHRTQKGRRLNSASGVRRSGVRCLLPKVRRTSQQPPGCLVDVFVTAAREIHDND